MAKRKVAGLGLRVQRNGNTLLLVVGVLVALLILGGVAWGFFRSEGSASGNPLLHTVAKGPFDHIVLEQGEVESSSNIEVRCEVKSRNTSGVQILWVIPEGSHVKKGDALIRLDGSALERDRDQQRISCNTSEAVVVQAKNNYEAALIARTEDLEGTYKQQEKTILGEVFVAEQGLRSAQLSLESAERLLAKGIITTLQLEGEQFLVDKAENELEVAQTKLKVLREYTRAKELKTVDSNIAMTKAKWDAEQSSHDLELKKLKDIEDQLTKCEIKAPADGQVVYANVSSQRGGSSEFVVEAGVNVREGQVIVRLPDPNQMQVKSKINESRVTLVKAGMPALVRLDAFSDQTPLRGEVTKVNQYAEPGGWFSSQVKEYATFIRLADAPEGIRTGLTAEVRIFVEQRENTLQLPVQGVFEHGSKTYCLVKKAGPAGKLELELRRVMIGSSNDKYVTIEDQEVVDGEDDVKNGIVEGEQVVLYNRCFVSLVTLPKVVEKVKAEALGPMSKSKSGSGEAAGAGGVPAGGGPETKGAGAGGPAGAGGAGRRGGPGGGGGGAFDPAAMFARMDANSDGKVDESEMATIPEAFRERFKQNDANGDGVEDTAEFEAGMARLRGAGGGAPGGGAPGGGAPGGGAPGGGAPGGGAPGGGAPGGGAAPSGT
ncbi:MAG: HlyD family efflux transporter periplasmic adaptor subunit [Planctomycetota bacterium]